MRPSRPLSLARVSHGPVDSWKFLAGFAGLAAALWYWKRRAPSASASPAPELQVVRRAALGNRGEVVVIDVAGQRILLGVTPTSVQMLTMLDEPAAPRATETVADDAGMSFEARLTAARKFIERLTPALLAKAFRGELVPQDPEDEPASVLLERIRAARQAEAGAGKPSRRGRRKAAAHPDQLLLDAAPIRPDLLRGLLRECGALSELALLAASELDPGKFRQQLAQDIAHGVVRETDEDGHVLLELVS